jgi:hypothetical protein
VIGGDEREPRTRQLDADNCHTAGVVDVIEVQQREHARVRAPPPQVLPQIDAVQPFAEKRGGQPPGPFVEVADDELGPVDVSIGDDRRQAQRLVPPLENGRAEMDVVDVQRHRANGDVDALQPPRFARLPGQIVIGVRGDGEATQYGVPELMPAQQTRRRHDPSHAERGPDRLGVPAAAGPGAHDLLQRHDIGANRAQHVNNPIGARAPVETAAAMDVVGDDAQREGRAGSHCAMIVLGRSKDGLADVQGGRPPWLGSHLKSK